MTTARVHDLLTAADLSYEPDDGLRRELHDGVVYMAPPPGNIHGWRVRVADRVVSANAHPWPIAIDMDRFVPPER